MARKSPLSLDSDARKQKDAKLAEVFAQRADLLRALRKEGRTAGEIGPIATGGRDGARPHPTAILRDEMAGFLAAAFRQVSARNEADVFVALVELWVLWMEPWTAASLLAAHLAPPQRPGGGSASSSPRGGGRRRGEADGRRWNGWRLACEDVFVLPLRPFLCAMSSAEFEGATRRDAQLHCVERVVSVLLAWTDGGSRGPTVVELLRRSPTRMLEEELDGCEGQRDVEAFLRDLHHTIVYGTWLSPSLDYDDIANYLQWAFVSMVVVPMAQVWELFSTSASAGWRLNRIVRNLASICDRDTEDLRFAMEANRSAHSGEGGDATVGSLERSKGTKAWRMMGGGAAERVLSDVKKWGRGGTEGYRGRHRRPFDAPICSYELYPLLMLAKYLSGKGDAVLRRINPRDSRQVNLRWIADMRTWGFVCIAAAVYVTPAMYSAVVSLPGAALLLCFAWIHRYPYQFYWFQNWLEGIGNGN